VNSSGHLQPGQHGNAANLAQGGSALASFLLGVPNNASRRNTVETEHGGWVDGFYFMEPVEATSKLSVNLGLRYDVTLVPRYGDSKNANNFVGDRTSYRNYILVRKRSRLRQTMLAPCIQGARCRTM